LLLEEEFVVNQERLKPQEEKEKEERSRVDDLRGSPMNVGNLEEIIDDDHAIVSSVGGTEYYVSIMSFVDKDQLEPGCSVLLHHKVHVVLSRISAQYFIHPVLILLQGHGYCGCFAKRCRSHGFRHEVGKSSN
jgi:26S proteasome regulatory subunit T2